MLPLYRKGLIKVTYVYLVVLSSWKPAGDELYRRQIPIPEVTITNCIIVITHGHIMANGPSYYTVSIVIIILL